MADPLPIEGRVQRVSCGRGTSELYMLQADVHEGIGIVTEIDCEFLAQKMTVAPQDFLGDQFTIEMDLEGGGTRKWLGTCVQATYLGNSEGMGFGEYPHFRVSLRGWPWLLTRIADCRIFQEKTADDIVKEIFSDHGFSDVEWKVSAAPPVREYCVQYRESCWDFVQRLLAEEGRFWFFDYSGGKDKLVICDDSGKLGRIPGESEIELIDREAAAREDIDFIDNWHVRYRTETDKVTLADYDFKKSNTPLLATRQGATQDYEEYDYPGHFLEDSVGRKLATRRLNAIEATRHRVWAEGAVKQLHAGGKFALKEHPRDDQNIEYLVLEAHHSLRIEQVEDDEKASIFEDVPFSPIGGRLGRGIRDLAESGFAKRARKIAGKMLGRAQPEKLVELQSVRFEAQPAKTDYVPPPYPVPWPTIPGVQTAVVVGPDGEEIHTDEFGRVKVQFHWDRKGERNEKSSCFIRVATPLAGKGWGLIHLPRIGQEVVVQFLEGEPDRPLIVGSVYNDQQTVPFPLPENKTRIGLVSDTHKNDDVNARHELWFEEKKDEEKIRLQSERDFEMLVKNSSSVTIGTEEKPDGDYDFSVWRHTTRSYGEGSGEGNLTEVVQNNFEKTLHDGDYRLTLESGSRTTDIAADETLTVGGSASETVSGSKDVTVSGAITITSDQKITLQCGGSKIEISPVGIKLTATTIEVKANALLEAKGSTLVQIQGGLVKIN